jgi:hypothetical protein
MRSLLHALRLKRLVKWWRVAHCQKVALDRTASGWAVRVVVDGRSFIVRDEQEFWRIRCQEGF